MPGHDIIVIGTSAGGVEALRQVARDLPADLAAAVFVVIHLPAHSPSLLPGILNRTGPLPALHAIDGEPISHGRIYVAPQAKLLPSGNWIDGPRRSRTSTENPPW